MKTLDSAEKKWNDLLFQVARYEGRGGAFIWHWDGFKGSGKGGSTEYDMLSGGDSRAGWTTLSTRGKWFQQYADFWLAS